MNTARLGARRVGAFQSGAVELSARQAAGARRQSLRRPAATAVHRAHDRGSAECIRCRHGFLPFMHGKFELTQVNQHN